jgi:T-complex protein 1 subunit epsilon
MSLAFDENGRPFIILREQEKKKRVKGLEAHKVSLIKKILDGHALKRKMF